MGSSSGSSGASSATGSAATGDALGTVETMYGPVTVPKPDDGELTVVALGWSDAEVALALGVKPVAVYDWLGFGDETKGVGPWAVETSATSPRWCSRTSTRPSRTSRSG